MLPALGSGGVVRTESDKYSLKHGYDFCISKEQRAFYKTMATANSIVNGGLPTPLDATFHHGIKTSGQQPPLYEELKSFAAFPDWIVGPTVWETQRFKESPDEWIHHFTKRELEEL
ncbi:MAG: hypothetical protein Q9164_007084, partial [Protoblastenia rupestris]